MKNFSKWNIVNAFYEYSLLFLLLLPKHFVFFPMIQTYKKNIMKKFVNIKKSKSSLIIFCTFSDEDKLLHEIFIQNVLES